MNIRVPIVMLGSSGLNELKHHQKEKIIMIFKKPRIERRADFNRNTIKWEPEDGEMMLIKDIPMDHFVNIMNWVFKHLEDYEKRSPGFYAFMEEEANFRKLLAFASGCQYPQKVGNRYILVGGK